MEFLLLKVARECLPISNFSVFLHCISEFPHAANNLLSDSKPRRWSSARIYLLKTMQISWSEILIQIHYLEAFDNTRNISYRTSKTCLCIKSYSKLLLLSIEDYIVERPLPSRLLSLALDRSNTSKRIISKIIDCVWLDYEYLSMLFLTESPLY